MSQISLKSISGITSITTPAGVDNVFTVHTNDTTEKFRVDQTGNQNISGIVTASNFKTGVSNLHSVGLTLSGGQLDVGNNIKAGNAGVVTASGADIDDFISVGSNIHLGNAGIITASSYRGDGSQLTGITGTTINNNADNRLITGSGTANTLEGESSLTYNGLQLNISNDVPELFLTDTNSNNSYGRVRGNGGNLILSADVNNATGGSVIVFEMDGAEKARITSDGKMGLNTNNPNPDAVGSNTVNTCLELGSPSGSDTASVIKFIGRQGDGTLNKCQIQWAGANNRFDITVNGNQALQIQPNKDVEVTDGDLIIGTSGHGISFAADGNASNMTNELFDDYEEGTWTPSYSRPNMTLTHGYRDGWYTKVGRVVHVVGRLYTTAENGSSSGGPILVTGLPFAVREVRCALSVRPASWSNDHPSFATFEKDQSFFELLEEVEGNPSGSTDLTGGRFAGGNGNYLWFSGTYFTDT